MYRFLLRPRWIAFHLLVLGAVVLMVNLGFWQLRRLDERQAFNHDVSTRIEQVVVPLDELVPAGTSRTRTSWPTTGRRAGWPATTS